MQLHISSAINEWHINMSNSEILFLEKKKKEDASAASTMLPSVMYGYFMLNIDEYKLIWFSFLWDKIIILEAAGVNKHDYHLQELALNYIYQTS